MFVFVGEFSPFLYQGGFVVLSVAVVGAVASIAHPASRLAPIVGCRPMQWIGARSYGIYLWHFPIIVLTTREGSTPGPALAIVQVSATFVVAALSWRYFEDPIRHGAIGRLRDRWRAGSLGPDLQPSPVRVATAGAVALVVLAAVAGFAGFRVDDDADPLDDRLAVTESVVAAPRGEPGAEAAAADAATTAGAAVTGDQVLGPCTSVVHIGGSTSLGLVSRAYIPDEDQQISAQYTAMGATVQHYEIAGGRAIIEGYQDALTAEQAAQKWRDDGYRGCWLMALGTMAVSYTHLTLPTIYSV